MEWGFFLCDDGGLVITGRDEFIQASRSVGLPRPAEVLELRYFNENSLKTFTPKESDYAEKGFGRGDCSVRGPWDCLELAREDYDAGKFKVYFA